MKNEILDVSLGKKPADIVIKNADLVNVLSGEIYTTDIAIHGKMIAGLGRYRGRREIDARGRYAVPGLIDGHTHIEMSMLSVSEFARIVVPKGTTAVVEDPHEIANVLGIKGIKLLLREASQTKLKVFCMAPSCVPSTTLETSGSRIDAGNIGELLSLDEVIGLGEVMDFLALIHKKTEILEKIDAAKGFPIDGHAPKLSSKQLNAYSIFAGSDHECTSYEEALEKLRLGMRVMIREGSAARNLSSLSHLSEKESRRIILITDGDRPPAELLKDGYLDWVLRRAIEEGIDPVKAIQMCTINPAEWFRLWNLGSISPGKIADIILVKNLEEFDVSKVLVDGKIVGREERRMFKYPEYAKRSIKIRKMDLCFPKGRKKQRIIKVIDGEILTEVEVEEIDGISTERDILMVVCVDRYGKGNISAGWVRGFGLKEGALASSIAHDSHNIIAVGTTTEEISLAINEIEKAGGGIAVCRGKKVSILPLPIAGLMSDEPAFIVKNKFEKLTKMVKEIGCRLSSPFLLLSFLSLPVIPKLKITDLGLVDVGRSCFVPLEA
jgi:adenine deaminase